MEHSLPMYVGVFTTDHSAEEISAICAAALRQVLDQGAEEEQVLADLKAITEKSGGWAPVKEPHITTLFMGKKMPKDEVKRKQYQAFESEQPVPVIVHAVAYVPKGLVVGVTHMDRSKVPVDNAHDHITLMLSGFSAKQSNTVLEEVFAGNGKLLASKLGQFADLPAKEVVRSRVTVNKQKHDAFLIKLAAPVVWSGKTRKMY